MVIPWFKGERGRAFDACRSAGEVNYILISKINFKK
jgi:hypothetical protein